MVEELFVYGTLLPRLAPEEIVDVVRRLVPVGSASVRGTLHKLDGYPGLTLAPAEQVVAGEVFSLPLGAEQEIWRRLDEYEGYVEGSAVTSVFVRERVTVRMDRGEDRRVWVYLYNA